MNSKKRSLEYKVYPLWEFLQNTFGVEEAFRLFGPYKGASISPKIIDEHTVEVTMPLVVSNTNYVGTQFGGSLYSMCDPFYMFLLLWRLGDGYMVWDKSAKIDFLKPGRSTVNVIFHISPEEIASILEILKKEKKTTRTYQTQITDEDGTIVASITKELYIRKIS